MIRKITKDDKAEYLLMAEAFYNSDAVLHKIKKEYFVNTFSQLMESDKYTSCYILEKDGNISGYALLARTFSQEAGGMVLWVEELYVKPECRRMGLANEFFSFLGSELSVGIKRVRLEVEEENASAIRLYEKNGFSKLSYMQMKKELN